MSYKRFIFILSTFVLGMQAPHVYAYSSGQVSHNGGSGDSSYDPFRIFTCARCHTGGSYTATSVDYSMPASMQLGELGSYSVKPDTTNAVGIGFNLAVYKCLSVSDCSIENLTLVTPSALTSGSGSKVSFDQLTHTSVQDPATTWSFGFTPPPEEATYIFHTCVVEANHTPAFTGLRDSVGDDVVCNASSPFTVSNIAPVANPDALPLTMGPPVYADRTTTIQVKDDNGSGVDHDGDAGAMQTLSVTNINRMSSAGNGSVTESATDGLVTYNPIGIFDYLADGESTTDIFTYTLSDQIDVANPVGRVTMTVTGVNDRPVVSVDATPVFQEGDSPVTLDSSITVSDADASDLINRARVVITNYVSGEDVLACTGMLTGITSCDFSAGTLTLSGTTSRTNYAVALQTVTYKNTSLNPTTDDRIVTFDVRDDNAATQSTSSISAASPAGSILVSVSGVGSPPMVTGFSGTADAAFTEGTAVAVNGAVGISDPEGVDTASMVLNRATMTLTDGYVAAEDRLVCPAALPMGITCDYNNAPALTLTSDTTNSYADYSAAIALVKYNNISENPDVTRRKVTLTVRDDTSIVTDPAVSKFISVTGVNDAPVITSTATPTTATEGMVYDYTPTVVDPEDLPDGISFTITTAPAGSSFDTSTGAFSWTPPRTNTFDDAITTFRIAVEDGNEDISAPDFEDISLTVSPPDGDADGVANYADNCPSIANGMAGDNQADNDNDTQYVTNAGFPVIGDVNPMSDATTGGDTCDTDDDNDGIPDLIEDHADFPFLDSKNAADAALDQDGDGLTNLKEYLNDNTGATIAVDSVGPAITAPVDVTVDATGLLTVVDLGKATGNDGNDGAVTIIKQLVTSTPAEAATKISELETLVTGCNSTLAEFKTRTAPFRPGSYTVIWASCDSKGNAGHDEQKVNVKPLVSVTPGQSVGEGQPVVIQVTLNGAAIAPSATVSYTLTGTASAGDDHDGVDGTVTLGAPDFGQISFTALADAVTESDETVVVTLHSPGNIALSTAKTHTVTITEANVAPQAVLLVAQPSAAAIAPITNPAVSKGNTVYIADGLARVTAEALDANGDTLSFDWSATDASLLGASGTTISANKLDFDPGVLVADNFYNIVTTVSDGKTSITIQRLLQVKSAATVVLVASEDRDGDGVDDVDEGFGDDDSDGIPNYADDASIPANAIVNNTVNSGTNFHIETDPGLHIALGDIAVAAQASGLQIGLQDIADHGGSGGGSVANAATDYTFVSSLLNFEITGLSDATESINVVVPLQSAIQEGTVLRKYNSSGWFDFVVDDKNKIRSAAGKQGTCPQPGSNLYTTGLNVGHSCMQLTIQDGGTNDTDGMRNYIVRDPGGLALAPQVEEEVAADADGRLGSVNLWFMLLLSVVAILVWRIRGQKV